MALTLGSLIVPITSDPTALFTGLQAAEGRLNRFVSKSNTLGAKLAKGFGLAFVGIGIAAGKMAVDFEKSMAQVATLIPKNQARINELGADVKRLAVDFGKSTDDLSAGLYQVVSAFGDTSETALKLEISARAAAAGAASTTDAINLLSAVTKGYGDTSAEAMQKASDLAFLTVKLGQTTFPELAASIGRTVPVAAKMGVSVEELNALFATLTGVTGDAAEVSTQISGIMRAMIKPTEGMTKAIKALGYEGSEALVSEKGIVGAMKALIGTTDGSTEAVGKLFRRAEALTALFALTGGQAEVFATKLDAMQNAAGSTEEAFQEIEKTLSHRLNVAMQQLSTALIDVGETLGPVIELLGDLIAGFGELVKLTKPVFDFFSELIKPLGDVAKGFEDVERNARLAREELERNKPENRGKALDARVKEFKDSLKNEKEAYGVLIELASQTAILQKRLDEAVAPYLKEGRTIRAEMLVDGIRTVKDYQNQIEGLQKKQDAANEKIKEFGFAIDKSGKLVKIAKDEIKKHTKAVENAGKAWEDYFETIKAQFESSLGKGDEWYKLALGIDPDNIDEEAYKIGMDFIKGYQKAFESGPLWSGVAENAGVVFLDSFSESMRSIGDLADALAVSFGESFAAGLSAALHNKLSPDFWKGILGRFTSIGIPVIGQLVSSGIGSILSGIGGVFGFGGPSEAEKRAEQEARRKEQEAKRQAETNKYMAQFTELVQKALISGEAFGATMAGLYNILSSRGADFSDVLTMINDAIEDQNELLKDTEATLAEYPDKLFNAKVGIDGMRDSMEGLRKSTREVLRELTAMAVENNFTFTRATGGGGVNRFQGEYFMPGVLSAIREAQQESREAGMRGYIRRGARRDIIGDIDSPQAKALVEQLIELKNQVALQELQIRESKENRKAMREGNRELRAKLVEIRNHLDDLSKFRDDFGKTGFAQIHNDLGIIHHDLVNIPHLQGGTPSIPKTGMYVLHAGEKVIPAGQAAASGPQQVVIPVEIGGREFKRIVVDLTQEAAYDGTTRFKSGTITKGKRPV